MKQLLLILMITISNWSFCQERLDPATAYLVNVNRWDIRSQKYEKVKSQDCSIPILFLKDRIRVKDAKNSVYYTTTKATESVEGDVHIASFDCYDELGDDCYATMLFNMKTGISVLVITYKEKIQYAYWMKNF